MKTFIIIAVATGICVVVISGVWVAIALVKAIVAGRPADNPQNEKNTGF